MVPAGSKVLSPSVVSGVERATCGNEIICEVGVPKGCPVRYFTVNLLRTVNTRRTDECTCIYYWVIGVYCGTDGVGSVKFVIWTENK